MISKPQGAPFASWVTGWFNLLGQVAVTTGIRFVFVSPVLKSLEQSPSPSFACATFISTVSTIGTNYQPNARKTIGIYAAVLFSQGLLFFISLSPDQP